MAEFKIVVSDPKSKKSFQKTIDQNESGLMGKKLSDMFKGDAIGLNGYELQITGGSDKDGFPMRSDVEGIARKRLLITKGVGFHSKKKGERKRKSIRGNTISQAVSQINTKIVKAGSTSVEKLLGKSDKKEAPKDEKPVEAKAEEKHTEAKPAEEAETVKEAPKEEAKPEEPKEETKVEEAPKKEEPKPEEEPKEAPKVENPEEKK